MFLPSYGLDILPAYSYIFSRFKRTEMSWFKMAPILGLPTSPVLQTPHMHNVLDMQKLVNMGDVIDDTVRVGAENLESRQHNA